VVVEIKKGPKDKNSLSNRSLHQHLDKSKTDQTGKAAAVRERQQLLAKDTGFLSLFVAKSFLVSTRKGFLFFSKENAALSIACHKKIYFRNYKLFTK
jgi:hypothetical protein